MLTAMPFQAQSPVQATDPGYPHDWSHQHVLFSAPSTIEASRMVQAEPRFWHQWYHRNAASMRPQPPVSRRPTGGLWGLSLPSSTSTGTVGAGNYPAKYSFNGGVSCSDFIVFNTSLLGTSSIPSVLAYKNIYSSCNGGVPTVAWQYNTGGTAATSVALSSDGTQIAFVQTVSGAAQLVLLKMGSSATLATLTGVANASYRACTAPCMTTFSLTSDDTHSSPFVDYVNDAIYVGDNGGKLYKYTGVFKATPAAAASPWPVTVGANKLTSPVYDSSSGDVFVADSGGFLYSYGGSTGTLVGNSSRLAASTGTGVVDAPLVDSSNHFVYVFVAEDNITSTTISCKNAVGCGGIFRFSITSFNTTSNTGTNCTATATTAWATGTNCGHESAIGVGSATEIMYDGAFDNAYLSGTGSSGYLWTCGYNGNLGGEPKLMYSLMDTTDFGSTTNVITSAGNAINPMANAGASCSPVTEILNGSTDYIYLSMTTGGNETTSPACTGSCIYSFTVSTADPPVATISHGIAVAGGASGIVIDNTASSGGGSQIYFSYLTAATSTIKCPAPSNATAGGCAVQASQAGLQ
jgi:hypothetical protein